MIPADRDHIEEPLRPAFRDSLDLDAAMLPGNDQANRWDYLLGHGDTEFVIGVEPHSAKEDQISTIIATKKAAQDQLRPHLRPGARVRAWLWVASGTVQFADTERARRRLDEHDIRFVGPRVLAKHLPAGPALGPLQPSAVAGQLRLGRAGLERTPRFDCVLIGFGGG